VYKTLENVTLFKVQTIKEVSFDILAKAVESYNGSFGKCSMCCSTEYKYMHTYWTQLDVKTTIKQNLQYYEHLAEAMAELLYVLEKLQSGNSVIDEVLQ
jgi:hypothetical protein